MGKSGITCYRNGGCGPYEMMSCSECPASKSDYLQRDVKKPITNYDRIVSKTPEELAVWLEQQEYRRPRFDGWLPLCNHVMGPRTCHKDGCEKCWLDWLRKEAKDD